MRVLFKCPNCGPVGRLVTGDTVACAECSATVEIITGDDQVEALGGPSFNMEWQELDRLRRLAGAAQIDWEATLAQGTDPVSVALADFHPRRSAFAPCEDGCTCLECSI